jgi:hypothetical protein
MPYLADKPAVPLGVKVKRGLGTITSATSAPEMILAWHFEINWTLRF